MMGWTASENLEVLKEGRDAVQARLDEVRKSPVP